jgi:hypothetical protein
VRALAQELGGLEWAVADVERPESVRALVERGDVLVSTVGPFRRWGSAAIEGAIGAGAHYLDSTGESPFIREVFQRYGPDAWRRRGLRGCDDQIGPGVEDNPATSEIDTSDTPGAHSNSGRTLSFDAFDLGDEVSTDRVATGPRDRDRSARSAGQRPAPRTC